MSTTTTGNRSTDGCTGWCTTDHDDDEFCLHDPRDDIRLSLAKDVGQLMPNGVRYVPASLTVTLAWAFNEVTRIDIDRNEKLLAKLTLDEAAKLAARLMELVASAHQDSIVGI